MATTTDRNETVSAMILREYKKAQEAGKERPTAKELMAKATKIDPSIEKMAPRSFTGMYILTAARQLKKAGETASNGNGNAQPKKRGRKPGTTAAAKADVAPTPTSGSLVSFLETLAEQMYETFGGTNRVAFHQFLGENLETQAQTVRQVVGSEAAAQS